jgi:hypothetical protein
MVGLNPLSKDAPTARGRARTARGDRGAYPARAVRSHVLVGDLGEQIAARYYSVELAPQFTPGHDLVDHPDVIRIDAEQLL